MAQGDSVRSILNRLLLPLISIVLVLIPMVWSRQINGNYYNAKLFLVYAISGFCCYFLATLPNKIQWPDFKKNWLFFGIISFILAFNLIQPVFLGHWGFILYSFKMLALIALVLFFINADWDLFYKTTTFDLIFTCVITFIIFVTLNDVYDVRFIKGIDESWHILGTFGNINMLAEFFLLSLPLMYFWLNHPTKIPYWLKWILFVFWIFLIVFSRSRSAWMSLGLWTVFLVWQKIKIKEALAILLGIGLYFSMQLIPTTQSNVTEAKSNSFAERLSLYKATSEMILDNPLGVGSGAFASEIIPYRIKQAFPAPEYEFADQPHSEILKWFAQYGWLGGLLCLTALALILKDLWLLKNNMLLGAFVVMIPQMSFQFPFENPGTLLMLAFYLGIWLHLKKQWAPQPLKPKSRWALVLLGTVMIAQAGLFITAIFVESQLKTRLDLTSMMCDWYPINIRNCNSSTISYSEKGQSTEARQTLLYYKDFAYFSSDFQRVFAFAYQFSNDKRPLCEMIRIYNVIYPHQKNFNQQVMNVCTGIPAPIQYFNPSQFKQDYSRWLEKNL